jgi:hypothetical protein
MVKQSKKLLKRKKKRIVSDSFEKFLFLSKKENNQAFFHLRKRSDCSEMKEKKIFMQILFRQQVFQQLTIGNSAMDSSVVSR